MAIACRNSAGSAAGPGVRWALTLSEHAAGSSRRAAGARRVGGRRHDGAAWPARGASRHWPHARGLISHHGNVPRPRPAPPRSPSLHIHAWNSLLTHSCAGRRSSAPFRRLLIIFHFVIKKIDCRSISTNPYSANYASILFTFVLMITLFAKVLRSSPAFSEAYEEAICSFILE